MSIEGAKDGYVFVPVVVLQTHKQVEEHIRGVRLAWDQVKKHRSENKMEGK